MKTFRRHVIATVLLLLVGLGQAYASTSYFVNLQAQSGHFVVAEGGYNDLLYANRGGAAEWETFEIIDVWDGDGALITGDEVYIRTFVGGRYVYATTTYPYGPFYPICGGSTVHAYNGGGLNNCRKWYIYKTNSNGDILWDEAIVAGDQVAISSYDGFWMQAWGGGGGDMNANSGNLGPWEKFFITFLDK